ncbi:ribonuclease H-like domain-containing protein [Tanacetum coccineum]|uniref:Ribonuclease H-like domain-containing protein n=1 Tax=Tanacetum coccineum TaxID=301880 RepID=A0ABQ4WT59_9ASTR
MLKHPIDQSTFRRGVLGAAPCVLPSAFSTMAHRDEYGYSPSTWHQRLGHLGEDVLRSLKSRRIVKPNPHFHGHTSHTSPISPIPKSPFVALLDPNWRDAMYDKYNALLKNSTLVLNPKPPNINVVLSMWLFRHKYHANGSLSKYKACLVANGRSQQFGVDYDDTLSPVVKPAIVRTGMFLSQKKYDLELLDRAYMANCNPTRTSVDTKSKLGYNGYPISDPTLYRSLAGGLQYLTFTRANISYAVQQHHRTKHIEIDIHFVRDMVARGQVCVLHVPSHYQYADIFTKGLPSTLFEEFRTSLSVQTSPAQTTGAY